MSYLQLFLQNYLIETAFLVLFFYREQPARVLWICFLANAFTHPLVVFGFMSLTSARALPMLLMAEAFAVLTEAFFYFRFLKKSFGIALAASMLANLLSWELGPRLSYHLIRSGLYF